MEFLYGLISKIKEYLILLLIIILLIVINDALIITFHNKTHVFSFENKSIKLNSDDLNQNQVINKFKVDLKGEVKKPGVYEVNDSMNVLDVINLAGGLKKKASTSNLNLSKKLTDQMVIVVSSKEKINKVIKYNTQTVKNDATINTSNQEGLVIEDESINNLEINESKNTTNTLININTASIEDLTKLPGIGKSKAELIIEYRNNSSFNTIDDIKNIKGIGESVFEKFKDQITV